MKLLNKLKALKKDKKGFTLIEIVIVIVIIAILAAMLVPSMLSWIDSANQRTFMSACGDIKTAVLSRCSENYASTGTFSVDDWDKVSELVGKTIASGNTNPSDKNTYNVTFSNANNNKTIDSGELIVKGKNYTGTWNGDTWDIVDSNS